MTINAPHVQVVLHVFTCFCSHTCFAHKNVQVAHWKYSHHGRQSAKRSFVLPEDLHDRTSHWTNLQHATSGHGFGAQTIYEEPSVWSSYIFSPKTACYENSIITIQWVIHCQLVIIHLYLHISMLAARGAVIPFQPPSARHSHCDVQGVGPPQMHVASECIWERVA